VRADVADWLAWKDAPTSYDQGDRIDLQSNFSLFTQYPIYFEDEIKEEHWINAMNEEMESIKKNDTWDLVDLPKEK
jgi:hypothetical protein